MKEYFSHDYNARNDQSLVKLRMKLAMDGLGIYWCLIEMLYENDGRIRLDEIETIAFDLRVDSERIADVLKNYGLFKFKKDFFYSDGVNKRIELRKEKSNKARASALSRWDKDVKPDANALRPQSDGNAIKVKESKVNKIKEREIVFTQSVRAFDYPKDMLDKFITYWTEPNTSGTKMKFELQQTWDTKRRLKTWADRTEAGDKPKAKAGF